MERNSREVGELIRARREKLGYAQADIPGVSSATMGKIERGVSDSYRRRTLRALMDALGWPPDGYERLVAGEDPSTWRQGMDVADHAGRLAHLRDVDPVAFQAVTTLIEQAIAHGHNRPSGPR